MDHIPRPKNPISSFPRIPLLCVDVHEDVDFMEYPEWAGWAKLIPIKGMSFVMLDDITEPAEITRLNAFIQRWAFFGLLRELLGRFGLFNAKDYVHQDEQGEVVCTTSLNVTLEQAVKLVKTWDMKQICESGDRMEQCMRLCNGVLYGLCRPGRTFNVDSDIWTSVLSICEAVYGFCRIHLEQSPESLAQSSGWTSFQLLPLPSSYDSSQMLELGWCPSEVMSWGKFIPSTHGQLYLRELSRKSLMLDHSDCSPDVCKRMQIDTRSYQPQHKRQPCSCTSVGPDKLAVATALKAGTFPILRVSGASPHNLSVEVVPFQGSESYVALSHVWADGLGNPFDTVLPSCQIADVWQLVQGLRGRTFTWTDDNSGEPVQRQEDRELFLWCDSLCCPTIPSKSPTSEDFNLKATAIGKLRDVYAKAAYVMVLDQSVRIIDSSSIDPLEQITRVLTCRWIRRLWTFQEATLAKKLVVVFADKVVDFRELWQYTSDLYRRSPSHIDFCSALLQQCINIRTVPTQNQASKTVSSSLSNLCYGIYYRGVTIPSDEPICIATALGIDAEKVSSAEESTRMEVAWRLLLDTEEGVPDDIVFNQFPRLTSPGFRWAPSSIRRPLSAKRNPITFENGTTKAVWAPHGIKIRRPGWRIEVGWPFVGLEAFDQSWAQQYNTAFDIRLPNGQWCTARATDDTDEDTEESLMAVLQAGRSRKWYIILEREEQLAPRGQRGLLTLAADVPGGSVYHSVCTLWVERLIPHLQVFHEVGFEHSEMIKRRVAVQRSASLTNVERLARFFVGWLPSDHERFPHTLIKDTVAKASKSSNEQLQALFREYGELAGKTQRASDAMEQARNRYGAGDLTANVYKCYLNGHAHAKELFDATQEWCID